jgi:hypothetical protein
MLWGRTLHLLQVDRESGENPFVNLGRFVHFPGVHISSPMQCSSYDHHFGLQVRA